MSITLTDAQFEELLASRVAAGAPQAKVRVARTVAVRVLSGSETAYGDLSIGKLNGETFQPKMGLNVGDIDALITGLRQAKKEINAK